MVKIAWKIVDELSDGHGVLLIYLPIKKSIAFIDGYGWYHGTDDQVTVELLSTGSIVFKSYNLKGEPIVGEAKDTISYFLKVLFRSEWVEGLIAV